MDIDRFGNLELNVSSAEIAAVGLEPGQTVELRFALTPYYAEVGETYADTGRGELILYEDSYGAWAIAINGGNAAALTEATAGRRGADPPGEPGQAPGMTCQIAGRPCSMR